MCVGCIKVCFCVPGGSLTICLSSCGSKGALPPSIGVPSAPLTSMGSS